MKKSASAIVIIAALFITAGMLLAQEIQPTPGIPLRQGEAAPAEGILFADKSLIMLVRTLKEFTLSMEKVVILEGQVAAMGQESAEKDRAIAELQEAGRNLQVAIDKLEFINANHKLIEDALRTAADIYKQALMDAREDNKALRSELFWTKIFSALPIIGVIATVIAGF